MGLVKVCPPLMAPPLMAPQWLLPLMATIMAPLEKQQWSVEPTVHSENAPE